MNGDVVTNSARDLYPFAGGQSKTIGACLVFKGVEFDPFKVWVIDFPHSPKHSRDERLSRASFLISSNSRELKAGL
jgi:hypothetical protein